MPRIEVFDPPMCCSTGVCGPNPQDHLARFSADLKWLVDQGLEVRRYNLLHDPDAFMANPQIKQIIAEMSGDGLPVVIVDGRVVSQQEYLHGNDWPNWLGSAGMPQQAISGLLSRNHHRSSTSGSRNWSPSAQRSPLTASHA